MLTQAQQEKIATTLSFLKKELGKSLLVAVSKYSSVDEIEFAYHEGQRIFGENRVQDLLLKAQKLAHLKDLKWHFIGHLQKNKIKDLLKVPYLEAIHSIHSLELLQKLLQTKSDTAKIRLFLEINTSGEAEKSGFITKEEAADALKFLQEEGPKVGLIAYGFMTMATYRTSDKEAAAHRCFKYLKELRDQLAPGLALSMGMSEDYKIALVYGADFIRIGSLIFKLDE